jgi:3-oxoacid CoA-transferase
MATAAKCVIAEVEEIVEDGEIDPECIHVPAVYVDRVFKADPKSPFSELKVEKLTVKGETEVKTFVNESDIVKKNITYSQVKDSKNKNSDPVRLKIASRAAKEVTNGMNVNLGIGIPTLLPSVLP